MGIGMGLIVAPLTDTVLSEVPPEHAGSASGLINTTGQMGNALGLGLTSVVFFGLIDDDTVFGSPYVEAFRGALWWVVAVLLVIFAVMFMLPRKAVPSEHREGGPDAPAAPAVPAQADGRAPAPAPAKVPAV